VETWSRCEVYFEGRVQGVGFRYTTQNAASGFQVVGFVQNLPDGRVRLVVEGAADELDSFLRRIDEVLGQHIENSDKTQVGPTKEFTRFEIRV